MEKAGAILVGKVNCHFRRDVAVTCFNPWDISRSPGHSGAGSGLAVAASMGLVSIGSDTGGSVRIPAAWSGVVGLRGTFGLISRHNLFGPSWSFDQAGPLAKTVEDTALALQALAVHDPEDPVSLTGRFPDYRAALEGDIEGVKVGVLEEYVGGGCTEEVSGRCEGPWRCSRTWVQTWRRYPSKERQGFRTFTTRLWSRNPPSTIGRHFSREIGEDRRRHEAAAGAGGRHTHGRLSGCSTTVGASQEGDGTGDEAGGRGGLANVFDDGVESAGDAGDD